MLTNSVSTKFWILVILNLVKICLLCFFVLVFYYYYDTLYGNNLLFSEAYSQPFSISGAEPVEEDVDAYDIVQAMQEVQLQAHGVKSTPVDTTGWGKLLLRIIFLYPIALFIISFFHNPMSMWGNFEKKLFVFCFLPKIASHKFLDCIVMQTGLKKGCWHLSRVRN